MRKVVIICISLLFILFVSICIIVRIDNKSNKDMKNIILKNTDIREIQYVNKYDNYYIVIDNIELYLLNNRFEEVYRTDVDRLYKNKNNYDIIYRNDTVMYMDNYKNKEGIIFKYYDIYTYEVIEEIVVGDN